jgi:hypothetical protein
MKRIKMGDVFTVHTDMGYKMFQYYCETKILGQHIRVFPGFHESKPDNFVEAVNCEHEYVIAFNVKRAYRFGFCELLGNASIPIHAIEPEYVVDYSNSESAGKWRIDSLYTNEFDRIIGPPDVSCLPEKYKMRNFTLGAIGPGWLMYLFESNFDLHHMDRFWPGSKIDKYTEKYSFMFEKKGHD